jgi:hypothetical protein
MIFAVSSCFRVLYMSVTKFGLDAMGVIDL